MAEVFQRFEEDLVRGIERGELVVHYQPRVALFNQRLLGFEALVRWNHPKFGLLGPEGFIPLAEGANLVVPLAKFVLWQACRQMGFWHRNLPMQTPLAISVNTSFQYLQDCSLIRGIEQILGETGLPPGSLQFEMTENSIIAHGHTAARTLRRLRAIGIGLVIDNFGTGRGSLEYLRILPFNALKIDQSFVKQLGTHIDSSEIIHATLTLGRRLGVDVAAAGVETQSQVKNLTTLGCFRGQGRYFCGPLNAAAAQLLIENEIACSGIRVVQRWHQAAISPTPASTDGRCGGLQLGK